MENAINASSHGWNADDEELTEAFYSWFTMCWQAGVPAYWDRYFAAQEKLKPGCPRPLFMLASAFADPARHGAAVREELRHLMEAELDDSDPLTVVRLDTAAIYLDLLPTGRRSTWRLIEDGRHGHALRLYFQALLLQCLDDFTSGHWTRAQELADEGLTASRNTAETTSWYFVYAEALLAAVRGDVTEAGKWASELERSTLSREAFGIHRLSRLVRTLIAQAQHDWESAYRHAAALSAPGTFERYVPEALWVAYDLVESALRTGRRDEAAAHAAAMQEFNFAGISPRLGLLTAGATALVDQTPQALTTFENALSSVDAASWPFDYARVQLAYGSRLRRAMRIKEARAVLHAALATFESIGARPWAVRARNELRAARDKLDGHEVMPSLTPQEWTIAELAAGGLSNKEIGEQLYLSPRTVGGHLYRIYPKLGITTRAALRDAISALRAAPDPDTLEC
jgi:ATP/maltotriose-dependent transcriptional regulator MalT